MIQFVFHHDRPIPTGELRELYNNVGWWPNRQESDMVNVLNNGPAIGAWQEGRLVGFARAVTDGKFRAFIEDVAVHEEYRRQGIGDHLIDTLVQYLAHIETISLFCESEHVNFYGKHGFKATKQVVMHLKGGN